MQIDLDRLEGLFPTIYVTFISVLLALALEDLLSQVRQADMYDPWIWIVGVSMLSFYIAVWTGYAFLAITQKRRPNILDTLNVFFVALGLFLLNNSVAQPHAYFFFAVAIYYLASMYAVFYNMKMFRRILPYKTSFDDYKWTIWTLVPHVVGFPVAGVLSLQGRLGTELELALGATACLSAIAWVSSFYITWNRFLDRAKQVALSS